MDLKTAPKKSAKQTVSVKSGAGKGKRAAPAQEEEKQKHRIYLIRYANLMKLFSDFRAEEYPSGDTAGSLKAFAIRCGMNERYFSHIKNERKQVGNDLARRTEEALGLETGWLDVEHPDDRYVAPDNNQGEQLFVETAVAFYRAAPSAAREKLIEAIQQALAAKSAT